MGNTPLSSCVVERVYNKLTDLLAENSQNEIYEPSTKAGRTGAVVSVADFGPRGSLVRDLAAAQFVVALSKSHLPAA